MGRSEKKKFLLRLDPELYRQIEGWAEQEMRSVNGHLEWLIREAVRRRRGQDKS